MFEIIFSLNELASKLDTIINQKIEVAEEIISISEKISKSWSQSWLGYHANVYYENFESPPPGAIFSKEWGLKERFYGATDGTRGKWTIYDKTEIIEMIYSAAGVDNIEDLKSSSEQYSKNVEELQSEVQSTIEANNLRKLDGFAEKICTNIDKIKTISVNDIIKHLQPSGQIISRDSDALTAGLWIPAHIETYAIGIKLNSPFAMAEDLKKNILRLSKHLENKKKASMGESIISSNIFIGHGQSGQWRELKDFIKDRLLLPVDEFNRVPVAGITNIQRLQDMMNQAAMAFLIMTAEDETAEGKMLARQNVIHEVGLFQGKLGFSKAIVILEDGCEEFSNISGLGQIRYPSKKISACFEEIRLVLEREGLFE